MEAYALAEIAVEHRQPSRASSRKNPCRSSTALEYHRVYPCRVISDSASANASHLTLAQLDPKANHMWKNQSKISR